MLSGGTVLVYAGSFVPSQTGIGGAVPQHWSEGSNGLSPVGWLVTANTTYVTSYTTDASIAGFIVGVINIFPYQIQKSTELTLGLYVSGNLISSQSYDVANYSARPATSLSEISSGVSNFTMSVLSFTVTGFLQSGTIPADSAITVSVSVTKPVWIQIDQVPTTQTAILSTHYSGLLPSQAGTSSVIAAHTISVGLESSAQ